MKLEKKIAWKTNSGTYIQRKKSTYTRKLDYNSAQIIDHEPHSYKRRKLESLHIYKNSKITVNFRSDLNNLKPIYFIIMNTNKNDQY